MIFFKLTIEKNQIASLPDEKISLIKTQSIFKKFLDQQNFDLELLQNILDFENVKKLIEDNFTEEAHKFINDFLEFLKLL